MDDLLLTELQSQTLTYAVGRQMFCQTCGKCLNAPDAALVEYSYDGNTMMVVGCGGCMDAQVGRIQEKIPGVRTEITDGRLLFHPVLF